jgi:hypothetical protein
MNYQNNGRINMVDRKIYPEYQMFYQKGEGLNEFKNDAIKTILQKNPLSDVFFSKVNIDYLQNQIMQRVYNLSGGRHKIGRQSDTELEIVMRSIYLQFSLNQPDNIREQVRDLDEMVISEVVPGILSAIEQYIKYQEAISTIPDPILLPKNETIKGQKSLQLPPWF